MIDIKDSLWPVEKKELLDHKVAQFKRAIENHKKTVGIPAPMADHPLIEVLAKTDEPYRIIKDKYFGLSEEEIREVDLEDKRQKALRVLEDAQLEKAAASNNADPRILDWYEAKQRQRSTEMTFYKRYKQLIDQTAHFVVGASVVFLLTILLDVPIVGAIVLMVFGALIRELYQHRGFDLGWGSFLDLLFFTLGGLSILLYQVVT